MEKVLQDIIQSEEEALRLENEAREQALSILAQARKKAEQIMEQSLAQGEEIAAEIIDKARKEADEERELNESIQNQADEQLRLKARERLKAAADFIAGRIVTKPWQ